MKCFTTAKDLGLEGIQDRNDLGAWIDINVTGIPSVCSYKCSACENSYFLKLSQYCPDCGALMVNYEHEKAKFVKEMGE